MIPQLKELLATLPATQEGLVDAYATIPYHAKAEEAYKNFGPVQSEFDLHRRAMAVREAENNPPTWPTCPVGTWRVEPCMGFLDVLVEVGFDDVDWVELDPSKPVTDPVVRMNLAKYQAWWDAGSRDVPPITIVERTNIGSKPGCVNGHHRAKLIYDNLGPNAKIKAWYSPCSPANRCRGLTWEDALHVRLGWE